MHTCVSSKADFAAQWHQTYVLLSSLSIPNLLAQRILTKVQTKVCQPGYQVWLRFIGLVHTSQYWCYDIWYTNKYQCFWRGWNMGEEEEMMEERGKKRKRCWRKRKRKRRKTYLTYDSLQWDPITSIQLLEKCRAMISSFNTL